MKITALFIQLYLVEGPNEHCYLQDLAWTWKLFVQETGVQEPENWIRDLVLYHNAILEEPPRGQSWRGWRIEGLGLNPEMRRRHSKYRLERMGLRS